MQPAWPSGGSHALGRALAHGREVPLHRGLPGQCLHFTELCAFLGVYPELILPGHPEQNGRHERFHKTLKDGAARPPASNLRAQQRRFSSFVHEYNHERPHGSLGQETPASLYRPSFRPHPDRIPELEYSAHIERRLVNRNGGIRWRSGWVSVSQVLSEEYVGIEKLDDELWAVYFRPLLPGRFDKTTLDLLEGYPFNKPM